MFVPQPARCVWRSEYRSGALVQQLADDEQRPALADEVEGVGDGAVLVVALGHEGV